MIIKNRRFYLLKKIMKEFFIDIYIQKNSGIIFFDEAFDAFRKDVLERPQSKWQKSFDNWFERLKKCIDLNEIILKKC